MFLGTTLTSLADHLKCSTLVALALYALSAFLHVLLEMVATLDNSDDSLKASLCVFCQFKVLELNGTSKLVTHGSVSGYLLVNAEVDSIPWEELSIVEVVLVSKRLRAQRLLRRLKLS